MKKKTISLALCFAMLISMLAVGFTTTSAATDESASTGYSKIESADDFSWDNANVYFLLTDRFANGDTSNDHSYGRALDANGNPLSGWQSAPGTFHGGDFKGLTQKINEGYFDDLGVNAIWLSAPYEQIHGYVDSGAGHFAHYSYHGYYVLDYTETDRNFGTKQEFKTLVDTAHEHGIRIVMDIVMNHAGYNNLLDMETYNYGTLLPGYEQYKYQLTNADAFHSYVDYESSSTDWGCWWGNDWVRSGLPGYTGGNGGDDITRLLSGLPDFRTESTASVSIPTFLQTKWQKEGTLSAKQSKYSNCTTVSDYLTTWLAEWVETYGVDGFRCDTAKHVELASWKKLKTKCVTALQNWRRNNPTAVGADWDEDFWMTGECWDYGSGKSEYHTVGGFDSMINFSFSGRSLDGPSSINNVYQDYADRINSDPNFNVLTYNSSHDSNLARGDLYWQGTSLMLLPGGVQPFYGDETNRPTVPGMSFDGHGGSGHSLRSDMNWNSIDTDVLAHWQKVGKFRNNHVAVGAGDHRLISAYNASTGYTFARTYDDGDVSDAVVCCIGAPANQNITVNLGSTFASGKTVTNEYDGTTAVVQNGSATFNSGPQGVILISGPQSTIHMSLKSENRAFYDSMTVTVSLRGADYAMVSIAGGTPFRVVDGQTFEIGEGIEVGASFDVTMTATNAVETSEMTFSYKKKDPNAVTHVYFDNTQYNWSNVNIYVYKGDGDSAASIKAWPGEAMEFDSTTGLYVYEVDEDFANEGAVVFNAGSGQAQYPAEGVRFDIEGTDKILINKTTWKDYEGETVETPEPPDPGTMRTVYFDNSSANYTTPCIHVWKSGSNDAYKPWPGITMTKGEGNLYYASFPATYDMCVFSDNKANQTGDITMPSYQNALYSNGSWSEVQEPTEAPTEAPTDPPVKPTEPQPDNKATVTIIGIDGTSKVKTFNVGDEFTVYTTFNSSSAAPNGIGSIDATQSFTKGILQSTDAVDELFVVTDSESMFPILGAGTVAKIDPELATNKFNASTPQISKGFKFETDDSLLAVTHYKVAAAGNAEVRTSLNMLSAADSDLTVIVRKGVIQPGFTLGGYSSFYEPGKPEPTEPPTEAPTTPATEPQPGQTANVTIIGIDGTSQAKTFNVGESFTVYTTLNTSSAAPTGIASIDATQSFTKGILQSTDAVDELKVVTDNLTMFPILGNAAVAKIDDGLNKFNASTPQINKGFKFDSDNALLAVTHYTVTAAGDAEVRTTLDMMAAADLNLSVIVKNGELQPGFNPLGGIASFTDPGTTQPTEAPVEYYLLGDADNNDLIDIVDSSQIQRYMADFDFAPDFDLDILRRNGDVDFSGYIEITDATYIQRSLADFEVDYPIGSYIPIQ